MSRYLIIFTSGLITSMLCMIMLRRASLKYRILNLNNISLVGGLGIGIAFVLSSFLAIYVFGIASIQILAMIGVSLIILVSGIVDDLRELSVLQKFLVQFICAGLLIAFDIRTHIVYIGFWANAIITLTWILVITNAFNLLDIVDGLASGIALIVSSAFIAISFLNPDLNMQALSLALFAANLGFLFFNLPPAKIYLGNSGSHFLGFLISAIALISHYASLENSFALFSPIVILWLPIMDTLLLVIFRVIKKKTPFRKSNDHVVFRISSLGFSRVKTLLLMFLLCFIFAGAGTVLTRVNSLCASAIITAMVLLSVILFWRLIKINIHG